MINTNINKREYTTPVVDIVILDNEISLVLATNPPGGPGEGSDENNKANNDSPWE